MIIETSSLEEITSYCQTKGYLSSTQTAESRSIPGEGNMNYVIRINHSAGSFILKQSRDYVQKYPQVAAPVIRSTVEATFYNVVSDSSLLTSFSPEVIGYDEENHIICLSDLGHMDDCTGVYDRQALKNSDIDTLLIYLAELHQDRYHTPKIPLLKNEEMRKLNSEHIFDIPFSADNPVPLDDITPGLKGLANELAKDERLLTIVKQYKNDYLHDGVYLLHGDYYPGSWLKKMEEIRIIDPEFCFYGDREWDYGVMLAHLLLSEQSQEIIDTFYKSLPLHLEKIKLDGFAGIEIIRRLLGLAQLPLEIDFHEKKKLIDLAVQMIKS